MSAIAGRAVHREDAFARIIATLDDSGDLARPALALAMDEYPGLNTRRYLDKLDDIADEALQAVVVGAKSECEAARRLAVFLAHGQGFHAGAFSDPRSMFLCDVLDRKQGVPTTLSLVLIEVGRRLGVPLVGIAFPGHFLVGCGPHKRNEYLLLDPYREGSIVGWNECELRVRMLGMQFDPDHHLSPISNRDFLKRMLSDLKSLYIGRRDIDRAIRTIARLTLLDPDAREDCRHLAATLSLEGDHESARRCLRSYLALTPSGVGAEEARALLCRLHELRALRN